MFLESFVVNLERRSSRSLWQVGAREVPQPLRAAHQPVEDGAHPGGGQAKEEEEEGRWSSSFAS